MQNEELYIGYQERAPEKTGRFMKRTVAGLLFAAVLISVLAVTAQKTFYPSTYEFLQYRIFEGVIEAEPYPMLRVLRPGDSGMLPAYSHYYLVEEGKSGAQNIAAEFAGRRVRLQGALIYRDDQVMVEVKSGTTELIHGAGTELGNPGKSLGQFTLTGEIVDSKCFLGVMNPGHLKPHRACAARCISGGIPPLLVVRDNDGRVSYLLLQAEDGTMVNKEVLEMVAEPIEVTGDVLQVDEVLMLRADPSTYRRLAP